MRQPDNVIFISLVNKFVTRQGDGARACRRSFAIGYVDAYCRGVALVDQKRCAAEIGRRQSKVHKSSNSALGLMFLSTALAILALAFICVGSWQ